MVRLVRILTIVVIGAKLAGCSSALSWDPGYHVVESGDTIYSIAFRYDVDQRALMAWNGIDNAALIRVGQRLRLSPPSGSSGAAPPPRSAGSSRSTKPQSTPSQPAQSVRWQWPSDGAVIAVYGSSTKTRSGIQIGGKQGQPVRAASGGRIVYAGTALAGYGHLLIIKHNNDYLSAYGHNDRLLVKEGDQVAAGQRIADMGIGPGKRPLLHFEIRLRGEPVNPVGYLPKR
ncbi:MAG: peptidoglycan DD-metalloendopeptidase family protein [Gammaproteobacteria bacterium]